MRNRYKGSKPYTEEESDMFFGRKKEINELFKTVVFENISILHSQAGLGKTSILKAGLIPVLKKSKQFETIYINIPRYKKSNVELPKIIENSFGINSNYLSFIDKLITKPDYFWYYLKKIQTSINNNKTIVLLFDSFENLFTYPDTIIEKFNIDLSSALHEIVPKNIKTEIREKFSKNPELLTDEGSKLLYNAIKLKVLFSIKTKNVKNLNELTGLYGNFENKKIELNFLNREQAQEIIEQAPEFISKYEEKNNFITKAYKFDKTLTDDVLNELSTNNGINPYELQIVLKYSEKLVSEKNISDGDLCKPSWYVISSIRGFE